MGRLRTTDLDLPHEEWQDEVRMLPLPVGLGEDGKDLGVQAASREQFKLDHF